MIFFCIAEKGSSLGFKLAGIETREVSGRSEALEALEVALAMEEVGIVLVTEVVAELIRIELDKLLCQDRLPIILEIPSRQGGKKRKTVNEFLKDMIGMSV